MLVLVLANVRSMECIKVLVLLRLGERFSQINLLLRHVI